MRAIHLYEELGLLTPAARSKGRYRLYGREALVRIRWIGKLQDMGFSLGDIQTIVREWERTSSAPGAMETMREVYEQKLEETREQQPPPRGARARARGEPRLPRHVRPVCDPQRLALGVPVLRPARQAKPTSPSSWRGFRAH